MKFSNIHPASESGFLQGIFSGGGGAKSIVIQISFVMLIFLLFSNQFFWGEGGKFPGKLLEGKNSSQLNNVSKHRNELFSKETPTNYCTVCQPYYNYYLLTGCKGRTRKHKPKVFHTARACEGCLENQGLVFPGTARAPS